MSRSRQYQQMLNSSRWKELRGWKLGRQPLCERCEREGERRGEGLGYVRAAQQVHHIVPVESARTEADMERLCFDPSNLQALCPQCHAEVHRREGRATRQNHRERTAARLQQWIERNTGRKEDT